MDSKVNQSHDSTVGKKLATKDNFSINSERDTHSHIATSIRVTLSRSEEKTQVRKAEREEEGIAFQKQSPQKVFENPELSQAKYGEPINLLNQQPQNHICVRSGEPTEASFNPTSVCQYSTATVVDADQKSARTNIGISGSSQALAQEHQEMMTEVRQ
ncbi:hypothetical protein BGZ46_001177 [Entomortierella lignicola]|nr:hypothetical protein BGZ46_001177 [Entomortierella lignicola]